jgi:serine/threonine protein phosphatase 1
MKVEIYAKNTAGTDYIVGDIHGCFEQLEQELIDIGFDITVDRLFCVGDLVDRGPNSIAALEWLKKPWFFAVRGNHEQMAIDFGTYNGMRENVYSYNGGDWFIRLKNKEQKAIKEEFEKLPFLIELETEAGKIGIVHAEVPTDDWEKAKACFNEQGQTNNRIDALQNVALWSRDRITDKYTVDIVNVDHVYVGHTPMRTPTDLGNVHYIDTGACFNGVFTIINANTLEQVN